MSGAGFLWTMSSPTTTASKVPGGRPSSRRLPVTLTRSALDATASFKPRLAATADERGHAGEGLEPAGDQLEIDLVGPVLVARHVQHDAPRFGDAAQEPILAHADEGTEVLGPDLDPLLGEHPHGGLGDERLGLDEHAVHVEDDPGNLPGSGPRRRWIRILHHFLLDPRWWPRPIRDYPSMRPPDQQPPGAAGLVVHALADPGRDEGAHPWHDCSRVWQRSWWGRRPRRRGARRLRRRVEDDLRSRPLRAEGGRGDGPDRRLQAPAEGKAGGQDAEGRL